MKKYKNEILAVLIPIFILLVALLFNGYYPFGNKILLMLDGYNQYPGFLNSFKDESVEREIAFFGGSFTGIEQETQEKLLKVAYEYVKEKKVSGIRVSTRPDYIDKERLKLLKKYGVKTIELGVQSTNDYILKKM